MSIHIGRKGWLGIAFETSAGSGGDDPVKYLPWTDCSLHNVVEVLDDEAAKGIRERAWGSVAARTRGEGDVEILLDVENAPYLLYPALGTGVVQEVEAGAVYQHTFTRKPANPPTTICLNFNDTVETRKYHYGTVNTCEISFSDGYATLRAGLLSQAPAVGTGSLSVSTETVLAFKDANIYFGSTFAEAEGKYQAGTGAIKLTAFTLTINNSGEAQYASGSSSPAQISMGQFELGGNYTLFFENTTERLAHENQSQRAMVISLKGGSIGAGSTEEILIEIPKYHLTDRGVDTAPAGFVTENPTFVGDYDSTYGSIIVKVINEENLYGLETESSSSSSSCSSSSSYSSSSFSSSSSSSCSSS